MSPSEFRTCVTEEGFAPPVEVVREPNGFLGTHSHPFEAKALILQGEIQIGIGAVTTLYRPGDVFHLSLAQDHWERYGTEGVVYLSARKQPQYKS
jgi:quercetin dioxygenase-like cupin family protein